MSFPVDDEKFGSADRNRNVYSSNSSRRSYAESFSSEQPIVHAREDNMGSSHLTTESEADEHVSCAIAVVAMLSSVVLDVLLLI